jgi:hypothetical protein
LLSGCATVRSEEGRLAACPPVVEYGREFQARAAEELVQLLDGSAIAEMLSDYAVLRDQAFAEGDTVTATTFIGEATGLIRSIEPAAAIVSKMASEAEAMLAGAPTTLG